MTALTVTSILNGEVPIAASQSPNKIAADVEEPGLESTSNVPTEVIECDVLVVGAGFSGITAIHRLRKLGLKIKCFESAAGLGGVWWWNRYPGARVDSDTPFYQLNIPEVYRDWSFSERFPGHAELRRYTAHIAKVLELEKDTYFHARVDGASWDENDHVWNVKTHQGHRARARYLVLASGLLHRQYTPAFPGLADYKGEIHHSTAWPKDFSAKGKKVAIIGAGATAVQITQELGKEADHLTVLLRRPSYCLPIQQRPFSEQEQTMWKAYFPALFKASRESATGFAVARRPEGVFDVSAEERERHWNYAWQQGGFAFSLSNFSDTALNPESNKLVYEFWADKVRQRLTDPKKAAIMAPEIQPYYFGTKRTPLEHDYYDVLNQPNVSIHDLNAAPLQAFTETGMRMADGTEYTFDAVALATGFDSFSGSVTNMGLRNKDGVDLKDLWKDGIATYLGMTVAGFPNMFMAYTPQSPAALSNGPVLIEAQVETIADMIKKLEEEHAVAIEAQLEAQEQWTQLLNGMVDNTLYKFTDSWWNGGNIPGKKAQNVTFIRGIQVYERMCRETLEGWKGFDVTPSAEVTL